MPRGTPRKDRSETRCRQRRLQRQVRCRQRRSRRRMPRRLLTHVGVDADEMENNQLEGAAVVQPLIEGSSFPDVVEVQADGVAGRNNSTRDDVVAVDLGASDSRMPSMSTGGAATKAMTKQMVAASSVGIISTPNQPTYRRLLVEVTHCSEKACQLEAPERCWRVVVMRTERSRWDESRWQIRKVG